MVQHGRDKCDCLLLGKRLLTHGCLPKMSIVLPSIGHPTISPLAVPEVLCLSWLQPALCEPCALDPFLPFVFARGSPKCLSEYFCLNIVEHFNLPNGLAVVMPKAPLTLIRFFWLWRVTVSCCPYFETSRDVWRCAWDL